MIKKVPYYNISALLLNINKTNKTSKTNINNKYVFLMLYSIFFIFWQL